MTPATPRILSALNRREVVRPHPLKRREPTPRATNGHIHPIESGCRVGELLGLRWCDVRWEHNLLLLPADLTKTAEDRDVPLTQRLKGVLEMRRHAPDGTEFPGSAFVFGNAVGERIKSARRPWERLCEAAGIECLH